MSDIKRKLRPTVKVRLDQIHTLNRNLITLDELITMKLQLDQAKHEGKSLVKIRTQDFEQVLNLALAQIKTQL